MFKLQLEWAGIEVDDGVVSTRLFDCFEYLAELFMFELFVIGLRTEFVDEDEYAIFVFEVVSVELVRLLIDEVDIEGCDVVVDDVVDLLRLIGFKRSLVGGL